MNISLDRLARRSSAIGALLISTTAAAQAERPATVQLTLADAVQRAVDHNPDLAIVRLDTEVEAARVGESRGAYAPVFSTTFGRSRNVTPPTNYLLGRHRRRREGLVLVDRRPAAAAVGRRHVERLVGHREDDDEQPDQRASIRTCSRASSWRSRSRCCRDRTIDASRAAVHHREAQPRQLGAALPRVGRADRGGRQAGVLDVQGDARQRRRPAALARAGAGAGATEQDSRGRRPDSAARSRPG